MSSFLFKWKQRMIRICDGQSHTLDLIVLNQRRSEAWSLISANTWVNPANLSHYQKNHIKWQHIIKSSGCFPFTLNSNNSTIQCNPVLSFAILKSLCNPSQSFKSKLHPYSKRTRRIAYAPVQKFKSFKTTSKICWISILRHDRMIILQWIICCNWSNRFNLIILFIVINSFKEEIFSNKFYLE